MRESTFVKVDVCVRESTFVRVDVCVRESTTRRTRAIWTEQWDTNHTAPITDVPTHQRRPYPRTLRESAHATREPFGRDNPTTRSGAAKEGVPLKRACHERAAGAGIRTKRDKITRQRAHWREHSDEDKVTRRRAVARAFRRQDYPTTRSGATIRERMVPDDPHATPNPRTLRARQVLGPTGASDIPRAVEDKAD